MTHRYRSLDFFLKKIKALSDGFFFFFFVIIVVGGGEGGECFCCCCCRYGLRVKDINMYQHPYTKIKLSLTAAFALSLDSRPLVKMFESVSSKQ